MTDQLSQSPSLPLSLKFHISHSLVDLQYVDTVLAKQYSVKLETPIYSASSQGKNFAPIIHQARFQIDQLDLQIAFRTTVSKSTGKLTVERSGSQEDWNRVLLTAKDPNANVQIPGSGVLPKCVCCIY